LPRAKGRRLIDLNCCRVRRVSGAAPPSTAAPRHRSKSVSGTDEESK